LLANKLFHPASNSIGVGYKFIKAIIKPNQLSSIIGTEFSVSTNFDKQIAGAGGGHMFVQEYWRS
jgi:hypothetical protein